MPTYTTAVGNWLGGLTGSMRKRRTVGIRLLLSVKHTSRMRFRRPQPWSYYGKRGNAFAAGKILLLGIAAFGSLAAPCFSFGRQVRIVWLRWWPENFIWSSSGFQSCDP